MADTLGKTNWKQVVKHPLFVALITVLITALITVPSTHYYDLKTIQYEHSLEERLLVDFIGQHEFIGKPNDPFNFNAIVIHNPSAKPIGVKDVKIYFPTEWTDKASEQKYEEPKINRPEIPIITNNLQNHFQPYMEIQPGKFELMRGVFQLKTPSKEGDYYLTFCAITYDEMEFCTKDNLIIHVRSNATLG
ncbi:hypothetical protein HYV86_03110 [Candidatus Woesearchaeota archaeon]|nr:hypothetical protein [Candidatus Woesearchaeota archaeon]